MSGVRFSAGAPKNSKYRLVFAVFLCSYGCELRSLSGFSHLIAPCSYINSLISHSFEKAKEFESLRRRLAERDNKAPIPHLAERIQLKLHGANSPQEPFGICCFLVLLRLRTTFAFALTSLITPCSYINSLISHSFEKAKEFESLRRRLAERDNKAPIPHLAERIQLKLHGANSPQEHFFTVWYLLFFMILMISQKNKFYVYNLLVYFKNYLTEFI